MTNLLGALAIVPTCKTTLALDAQVTLFADISTPDEVH